ncbi:MAG: RNA polymerase sigma factor [Planctomycetota bacterium]
MWYPRLFRTALRLTGSEQDADDMTQQAFCKALSSWDRFDGRCQPLTWLHSILLNCVRDAMRRRVTRQATSLDEWAIPAFAGFDECVAEGAVRQEELRALRNAIEQLGSPVRQAFVATVLDGYSYRQAAEMLDVPVGTISSRVYQARQELKSAMIGLFGGRDHDE